MFRCAGIIRSAVGTTIRKNIFTPSKEISRLSSITTWNKDWKPGPYPRTEEERIAAAKKYHLIPEDYQPYPEEEGYGDYPMFENVHNDVKDDFELYDDDVMKRNYCEPIHPDFDISLGDRVNFNQEFEIPFWKQMLYLFSGAAIWTAIWTYDWLHPTDLRIIPKQYPHRGEKAYTFEPAEE